MADQALPPSGIYCIRDRISGRVYVGSAAHIARRWRAHRSNLSNGKHPGKVMQASWIKHGPDAFEFSVLERVADLGDLIAAEQRWIDALDAANPKTGFNVSPTAGNCLGVRHTEETKAKLSGDRRGKPKSPEHRKAIGDAHRGRTIPADRRARIAETVRRHFAENPEARERMREVGRANGKASAGRKLSDRGRKNISEARLASAKAAETSRANLAKVDIEKLRTALAKRPSMKGVPNRANRHFTFEQAEEIRALKAEGWTYDQLEVRFETNRSSLFHIVNRKTYVTP